MIALGRPVGTAPRDAGEFDLADAANRSPRIVVPSKRRPFVGLA
jgi:hypothetical protein